MLFGWAKRACLVATLCVVASTNARAEAPLYGLVQTPDFNELLTYDLTQDLTGQSGYEATILRGLNFTDQLPQNSIVSIAVEGTTLYGLVRTPDFNELLTYDLTQDLTGQSGYEASRLRGLNFTDQLPQNSIVSIAVEGTTLYGLVRTPDFNELLTYDLTQDLTGQSGYEATILRGLNFTDRLPQYSIVSIAVDGTTLYGLVRTPGFNELLTYGLTQDLTGQSGYEASRLRGLNFTDQLPQNSIVSIAVDGRPSMALLEPRTSTNS